MSTLPIQTCVLQRQGEDGLFSEILAEVIDLDNDEEHTLLILAQRDLTDNETTIRLTATAWQALVEMYILRYPAAAQRIVTKAQGWSKK